MRPRRMMITMRNALVYRGPRNYVRYNSASTFMSNASVKCNACVYTCVRVCFVAERAFEPSVNFRFPQFPRFPPRHKTPRPAFHLPRRLSPCAPARRYILESLSSGAFSQRCCICRRRGEIHEARAPAPGCFPSTWEKMLARGTRVVKYRVCRRAVDDEDSSLPANCSGATFIILGFRSIGGRFFLHLANLLSLSVRFVRITRLAAFRLVQFRAARLFRYSYRR